MRFWEIRKLIIILNCGIAFGDDWSISPKSWLLKLDDAGNVQWDIEFKDRYGTQINSVKQLADGGYIACGTIGMYELKKPEIFLLKIAPEKKKSFSFFN